MMLDEGVERMWQRQADLAAFLRAELTSMGLRLYANPSCASASITSARPPAGMTASRFRDLIREDSGIEVAIGQKPEAETMIRIGTMGWTHRPEIEATLESIGRVLRSA
jgi:aspartate aminotransferase-like enzyme